MANITVFGAGGFIGKHLVRALAEESDNNVIAFDHFSRYQTGEDHPFVDYKNVRLVAGDFFNQEDVSQAVEGSEYVFHLITSTNPATSKNDPFIDIDTNVRNTVQLLEICVEHGVKRVLFPSSGGTVYGDISSEAISEAATPQPISPYGIGKLTVEHYLRYFKFTSNLDYIVYRISNPYGPGQNIIGTQGVIPIFMHRFVTGEPLVIYGDGSMVRDYLYIDDLVAMLVGSFNQDHQYSEYNLGSGKGVSVNDLVSELEQCMGKKANLEHAETPPTFIHKSVLDISRFTSEFSIKPAVAFGDGISRTWDYVKRIA